MDEVSTQTPRGSGRTYRAVAALPDGAAYVTHSAHLHPHIRSILEQQGRSPDALHLTTVSAVVHGGGVALTGMRLTGVDIDHHVWDAVPDPEAVFMRVFTATMLARMHADATASEGVGG